MWDYLNGSSNKTKSTNYLSELGSNFATQLSSIKIESIEHFSDKNTPFRGLPSWRRVLIHERYNNDRKEKNITLELDTNKHFGFCCVFFAFLEIQAFITKRRVANYANMLLESKHYILDFSRYIFIARFAEIEKYDCEVEAELDRCNFNQEQREFIWKWVRREINLVEIVDSEEEN